MKAIDLPSGDHLALRSWIAQELVRLRVGPCCAGTVKISPRAQNSARLPGGATSKLAFFLLTWRGPRGRVFMSSLMKPGTFRLLGVVRSGVYSQPPFSKTMALLPSEGNLMSKSLNSVSC